MLLFAGWVVLAYIRANGAGVVLAVLLLSIAAQALSVAGGFWMTTWAGAALAAYLTGGNPNTQVCVRITFSYAVSA